jgi:hypothetical protein
MYLMVLILRGVEWQKEKEEVIINEALSQSSSLHRNSNVGKSTINWST